MTTTVSSNRGLQGELDLLTRQLREKRGELHQSQLEIERLNRLVSELEAEKNELANELCETRVRLDKVLSAEEVNEQTRVNLANELYEKQRQIDDLQSLIESLGEKKVELSGQQIAMIQQQREMLETELTEVKVTLDKRETELRKTRDMYIEMCEEKNNLQDMLKSQLDAEYELRLKERVENVLGARLEEQKLALDMEFSKQLDAKLGSFKIYNTIFNTFM